MAITTNNPQSYRTSTDSNSYTLSYAVASGTDRVLVVMMTAQYNNLGGFTASATYDGAAMSEVVTDIQTLTSPQRYWRSSIWYLVNPPVGTANIVISLSVIMPMFIMGAITLHGVSQTAPLGSANSDMGNPAAAPAFTGLPAGAMLIGAVTSDSGGPPTYAWTNGTEIYDLDGFGNFSNSPAGSAAYYLAAGGGNVTMTATRSATGLGQVGVAAAFLEPATGGGQPPRTMHQAMTRRAG